MIRVYKKRGGLNKLSAPFVRECLGKFLDQDPSALKVSRHPSGQPFVEYETPVYFSLTHSGGFLSLACSFNFDLGLDLQIHQNFNPNLFQTICCGTELVSLKELNEKNFFKVWTIKEAALKCLGLGLRLPMNQLQIDFEQNQIEVQNNDTKFLHLSFTELSLFENSTAHLVWARQTKVPKVILMPEE